MACPVGIDVWVFSLDVADWRDALHPCHLSDDEIRRASAETPEAPRRRFAVCRAPGALRFGRGPHGKPGVTGGRGRPPVHFNVSHSEDLALVAVSRDRAVGVDVERVRPRPGFDALVARHFAPAERAVVHTARPAERLSAFYRLWTLKEACLKAGGAGLREPLAALDVTAATAGPIAVPPALADTTDRLWVRAVALDPASGYAGALAVDGRAAVAIDLRRLPVRAFGAGAASPSGSTDAVPELRV